MWGLIKEDAKQKGARIDVSMGQGRGSEYTTIATTYQATLIGFPALFWMLGEHCFIKTNNNRAGRPTRTDEETHNEWLSHSDSVSCRRSQDLDHMC